jgi:hypothetical protein
MYGRSSTVAVSSQRAWPFAAPAAAMQPRAPLPLAPAGRPPLPGKRPPCVGIFRDFTAFCIPCTMWEAVGGVEGKEPRAGIAISCRHLCRALSVHLLLFAPLATRLLSLALFRSMHAQLTRLLAPMQLWRPGPEAGSGARRCRCPGAPLCPAGGSAPHRRSGRALPADQAALRSRCYTKSAALTLQQLDLQLTNHLHPDPCCSAGARA